MQVDAHFYEIDPAGTIGFVLILAVVAAGLILWWQLRRPPGPPLPPI